MIDIRPDRITIYINQLIKPYYIGNTELFENLLYQLRTSRNNRPVYIQAINTPLFLPLYRGILDTIADALAIPKEQLLIITREHDLDHPRATKVDLPLWGEAYRRQCRQALTGLGFKLDTTPVRFGALFGRIQWGRIKLAHHLETAHPTESYVIIQADKHQFDYFVAGLEDFYKPLHQWWHARQNPADSLDPHNSRGELNFPDNIIQWPNIWGRYVIEVLAETEYQGRGDWTEKTWKCLGSGKPFIALNGPGSLKSLRDMGYETYAPWINETYDTVLDYHDRIQAICNEIDRLAALAPNEWQMTQDNIMAIAERNKKIFFERNYNVDLTN